MGELGGNICCENWQVCTALLFSDYVQHGQHVPNPSSRQITALHAPPHGYSMQVLDAGFVFLQCLPERRTAWLIQRFRRSPSSFLKQTLIALELESAK